jgi:uncharacterized protein YndB with AHSA1/START domain
MTSQKSFKRRVRARMQKTGESYMAARRQLIDAGEHPPAPVVEPRVSDEAVERATGRTWPQWFELLDRWGATGRAHPEIARWLADEHGVGGWWAQGITVSYEQARGMRAPGERPGGFSVTASKTMAVPVGRLFAAVTEEELRERWLPGAEMRLRTSTAPKSARYDWEDGSTRVVFGFIDKSEAKSPKSQLALEHERLPDADAAEGMKAWWRERVAELKRILEQGE